MATYKEAGVDIDSGNALVEKIKPLAKLTKRDEVLSGIGGFSGLFSLGALKMEHPVLVAATDGIGTKLKVGLDYQKFDGLGQDLVAMCVNDLICCGAEPLFFLDYFATSHLDVDQASAVINSVSRALKEINCALLGGETAEMPGLYQKNDFDVAGFAVGVVDKNKIIDGQRVSSGNKIIGLGSSGIHSNGYSLVRKIIADQNLDLHKIYFGDKPLGDVLLEPTRLYVNPVLELLKHHDVLSMAHITGGGLIENLPRVLPSTSKAVINSAPISTPPLFEFFQKQGQIEDQEMWRVFNMGVGFAMVLPADQEQAALDKLNQMNVPAFSLGEIHDRSAGEPAFFLG